MVFDHRGAFAYRFRAGRIAPKGVTRTHRRVASVPRMLTGNAPLAPNTVTLRFFTRP